MTRLFQSSQARPEPPNRMVFIDNIRILLTAVVILNHLSITYGAPGGWYYSEFEITELDIIPKASLIIFAAINQAYSMGFFFLISGYFSAKSISKSNSQTYLARRLIRLGIPIFLFVYLVSPILRVSFRRIAFNTPITIDNFLSVYQYLEFGYELGPMWFIALLLIFSALLPLFLKSINRFSNKLKQPHRSLFFASAALMGLATFLVRIPFPIGTVFQPLNLQLPHTVQYIAMFVAGVILYQTEWREYLPSIKIKVWIPTTLGLFAVMPILFFVIGGSSGDVSAALGGFTWQSLVFSIWEQFFAVCMIAGLLAVFYKYLNKNSKLTQELAASSYATYIFHPLFVVILTALFQDFQLPPVLKFALLSVPTLIVCFLAASILRRVPGLKSII